MDSKDAFILLSSDLLTSSSRDFYSSDKSFVDSHRSHLAKIIDPKSTHFGKAHDFFLDLKPDCGEMCHESLLARFSADKYRILTADKAVVFASVAEIEAFVSDNSDSIQHYIPVLPTTKIDAGVRQMASEEGGCTAVPKSKEFSNVARLNRASYINRHKKTGNSVVGTTTGTSAQSEQLGAQEGGYPSRKLLVVVAALSPTELQELTHELEDMSKDVNLPFGIPNLEDDLVAGRKSKMVLTVNDCRHIDSIVKKLSHRREVLWIEQYNDVVLHNRWAKGVCQSGDYTSTPMFNANLTGTGEIIGVVDTGLDVTSCYFFDENNKITYNAVNNDHRKVVSYIYSSKYGDKIDDSEGHGTHVAGIVAGRSYKDWGDYKAFRGNAYDAKIAFYDAAIGSASITVPSDITTIFDSLHDAGARIMSNSWGDDYSSTSTSYNKYSSKAIDVDEFMWKHNDTLILFAAGNSGDYGANTVVSPGTCKSCVTVGASLNAQTSFKAYTTDPDSRLDVDNMGSFSGRGPTYDGRMKPDVLAPGWWVASAASEYSASRKAYNTSTKSDTHCDLHVYLGTSMATPAAAASAALIRQYFREGYYPTGSANAQDGFIPSGALLKAMLVHSGQAVDYIIKSGSSGLSVSSATAVDSYPDNNQGYGRVQVNKVLNFAKSASRPISLFVVGAADPTHSLYRSLRTSGTDSYYFTTSSDSSALPSEIVVTLAYTDYPGTHGSKYLINNLDVVLVDGSTQDKYYPLSYHSQGYRSPVEKIILSAPRVNCTYTVQVSANGTLSYTQPYALVVTGTITETNLTSTSELSYSTSGTTTKKELDYVGVKIVSALAIAGFFLFVIVVWIYAGNRKVPMSKQGDGEGDGDDNPSQKQEKSGKGNKKGKSLKGSDLNA